MLHVAKCFKEIVLLFNVHLSFLWILACAKLTNTCPKLTVKKLDQSAECSKLKINIA